MSMVAWTEALAKPCTSPQGSQGGLGLLHPQGFEDQPTVLLDSSVQEKIGGFTHKFGILGGLNCLKQQRRGFKRNQSDFGWSSTNPNLGVQIARPADHGKYSLDLLGFGAGN